MHRGVSRRWALQLAGCAPLALGCGMALAGRQLEEPLADAVRTALSASVAGGGEPPQPVLGSPAQQQDYHRWLQQSSGRLVRYKSHPDDRQEFLQTLWYEVRRAGLSLSLVLGLIQVESAFRKYALSSAGARGYMQVMPFWSHLIGDGDERLLFQLQPNLRFGCVILRHYMDREAGDLSMALGRYNGSRGQAAYPRAVLAAQRLWLVEVD